ncbi:MAG: endolytic transglycosylase MltG [Actinobacteria bacterium]|nr:endolytic transglycosylase MltG [Actinomycetota bacterium]
MGEQVIPPVRGRPRPSRREQRTRRAIALTGLLGALAVVGVLGSLALGALRESSPPPAPVVVPPPKPLRIVFPEGFTIEQMAERIGAVNTIAKERRKVTPKLKAAEYTRLTRRSKLPGEFAGDGKSRPLEGFLFPATYEFLPKTTTKQLVNKQIVAFHKAWDKLDLGYAKSKNLTPYEALIIASMVEKETLAPDERPKVAAVIYNRLKAGMTLGIDATLRYGLDIPPTESIKQSQLESDNPYNTRRLPGLPPTPIANPGLASMQAAAHPANVDYLFFVRKPDKVHHFFTTSEAEFLQYLAENGYGG